MFNAIWGHTVVGIHSDDVRRRDGLDACVESRDDALVGLEPDDLKRSPQRGINSRFQRWVIPIIREKDLKILGSLRIQIAQHLVEMLIGSVTRNDYSGAHERMKVTNLQPHDDSRTPGRPQVAMAMLDPTLSQGTLTGGLACGIWAFWDDLDFVPSQRGRQGSRNV
jgi:hypothetical protein